MDRFLLQITNTGNNCTRSTSVSINHIAFSQDLFKSLPFKKMLKMHLATGAFCNIGFPQSIESPPHWYF